MSIDEFYFHEKRKLPKWEKWGHPLDSLLTLLTLLIPVIYSPSEMPVSLFVAFAIFSCVFITKDEFIHSELCSKFEHWLHAMLFILHPLIFVATYLVWVSFKGTEFLTVQAITVGSFMIYQLIRWNIYEN